MDDQRKSKAQLTDELVALRQEMAKPEELDAERKRVEETLTETNQLLGTILDHTHMLVAYLDPQFNFVRVNRAYAEADEKVVSFFPGKNHFDLYPNEENEAIFKRVVETGEPYFAVLYNQGCRSGQRPGTDDGLFHHCRGARRIYQFRNGGRQGYYLHHPAAYSLLALPK